MTELSNHIGPDTDIPAGDIGVGVREIGYLFGWYKKLANEFGGSLTGKALDWGGSILRPEATGYGLLYFVQAMLDHVGEDITVKTVAIAGSSNVAQNAAIKAVELGAKVITISDSGGFVHDPDGFSADKLAYMLDLKNQQRGRLEEYARKFSTASFHQGEAPWGIKADIYLPCATQNEIDESAAKLIVANHAKLVAEGANMPSTPEAIAIFEGARILYAPGKASNAGGVAVSGLEMSQNSMRISWGLEEVDERLKTIMKDLHAKVVQNGSKKNRVDYVKGANTAGFLRVADAMLSQGIT